MARPGRCTDYLLVGQRVWQLAFTPDEKLLFTTNGISNDVSVIDVENTVVKSIRSASSPGAWRSRRMSGREAEGEIG